MVNEQTASVVRVLLVDDSEPLRQRLRVLVEEGTQVQVIGEADSVASAIAAVERVAPDAVVLDLNLPDGSGYTVLQAIRRIASRCLVIVLTQHASPEHRKRCRLLGADHFLDKNADFERLPSLLALPQRAAGDAMAAG